MKRLVPILLAALALALALSGCRTRIVDDSVQADGIISTESPATPEPTAEPEPSQTPEPTAEPSPDTGSADDADESEETEPTATASPLPGDVSVITEGDGDQGTQAGAGVTVTYDSNGGDTPSVSTVVQPGGSYGAQPSATRRGYSFAGWWTEPDGGSLIGADTVVTSSEDHTLYARWADRVSCTITLDGNGGRVKSQEQYIEISDGDAFGELPEPIREGYSFNGWFTALEGGEQVFADTVFNGTSDITLYARWTYEPFEFWSFTLANKTQQIYLCQQASIFFELEAANQTQSYCQLISDTGSLNIAESLTGEASDEWVLSKNPRAVIKLAGSLSDAAAVRQELSARFPDADIIIVTQEALGSGAAGLYARIALAKHLYTDWYLDVDLATVAQELGVTGAPINFG